MSGLTMIVIGLVLGLAGGWSIRTVLMLVGFGAGWLLANVFDASFLVTLVIALVAALFAWLIVRLAAAIVFIPAIGIAGGWLAEKTKERFVAWGTSIGGAALVLAGVGVLVSGLAWLRDPTQTWQAVVGVAAWVGLSVVFRLAQRAVGSGDQG